MVWLVLIETAGNQDYVFATNKLRENVGASELLYRIGTTFVLKAVAKLVPAYEDLSNRLERAIDVVDEPVPTADYVEALKTVSEANPFGPGTPVEIVVATSGKAVLLVDTPATGEAIIQEVTLRALREAPGAVVRGNVDSVELDLAAALNSDGKPMRDVAHWRMKAVHEAVNDLRRKLPPPEARFLTMPIIAPCATSGLPAERLDRRDGSLVSAPVIAKREAADAGWRRVKASLRKIGHRLSKNIERLDDDMQLPWLGAVHADGNGFGKVFLDLARCMPPGTGTTARDYFNFYRGLSFALDLAGVKALEKSLEVFAEIAITRNGRDESFLPIVPLVFGGDDLTVVCDGRRAVTFAEHYLQAFENKTDPESAGFPTLIDPKTGETKSFGGGAGVAIVKPHHPFHRAYDLAEDLTKSAKVTKTILNTDAVSTVDFQVVYQDAASDLRTLRNAWARGGELFHARPYVVSEEHRYGSAENSSWAWAERHHIKKLRRAMAALKSTGDEEVDRAHKVLPRSQQHALREALFAGVADQRFALVRERYDQGDWKVDWEVFGESRTTLFFEEQDREVAGGGSTNVKRTRLLDAMELIDIGEEPAGAKGEMPGTAEAAE